MNLSFSCAPSGFSIHGSALRKASFLWAWLNRLIAHHQDGCPYCRFEKDPQTGREVGQ